MRRFPATHSPARTARGGRKTKIFKECHMIDLFQCLGGSGKNALVRLLYCLNWVFPSYFFSNSGMPDTNRINAVMVAGPKTVFQPPCVEQAISHTPHQRATSPK